MSSKQRAVMRSRFPWQMKLRYSSTDEGGAAPADVLECGKKLGLNLDSQKQYSHHFLRLYLASERRGG
jgi:hypothetical protein